MEQPQEIMDYWQAYRRACLANGSADPGEAPAEAWSFGDNPPLAGELAGLVVQGIKTATCTSVWELEVEGEPIPRVGGLSIILDGSGKPVCIIETVEIETRPFQSVEAGFAYDEGEDDRSLDSWRREHRKYFERGLLRLGMTFSTEMPVVCERFRVVWRG